MFYDIDTFEEDGPIWVCDVSHDNHDDWQEYHRSDAVFFTVHHVKRHAMLICSVTELVSISHLVSLVSGFSTVE